MSTLLADRPVRCRRYSGASATDKQALLALLEERYASWAAGLDTDEENALRNYLMASYEPINGVLRGWPCWLHKVEGTGRSLAQVAALDAAIGRTATPFPLTVYRGIKLPQLHDPQLLVGTVIEEPGFCSVSLDVAVARKFTRPYHEWDYHEGVGCPAALLQIALPAGTRAAFVAAADPDELGRTRERELLLARGARFHVTGLRQQGSGGPRLLCQLVG